MAYLVDSDWIIDLLNSEEEAIDLFDAIFPEGVSLSVVTYLEIREGMLRSPDAPELRGRIERLALRVPILPVTITVAETCADLRAELRAAGKRVNSRAMDLLIAATAIEHDLTLVTRNRRDYDDIPGLRIFGRD